MKTDQELLRDSRVDVHGNVVNILVLRQEESLADHIRQTELSRTIAFKIFKENPYTIFHFIIDVSTDK